MMSTAAIANGDSAKVVPTQQFTFNLIDFDEYEAPKGALRTFALHRAVALVAEMRGFESFSAAWQVIAEQRPTLGMMFLRELSVGRAGIFWENYPEILADETLRSLCRQVLSLHDRAAHKGDQRFTRRWPALCARVWAAAGAELHRGNLTLEEAMSLVEDEVDS